MTITATLARPAATASSTCTRCGIDGPLLPGLRCADCTDLECRRGHLYPEDAFDAKGHRICRVCARERRTKTRPTRKAQPS